MSQDKNSLSHTTWKCNYHIFFAPKYRRQAIYGKIKQDIGILLRQLCERKGVEIIEATACVDHIHMFVCAFCIHCCHCFFPSLDLFYFLGFREGFLIDGYKVFDFIIGSSSLHWHSKNKE